MLRREQKNHSSKVDGVFGLDTMDTGHLEEPAEMGCKSIIKAELDSSLFYFYLLFLFLQTLFLSDSGLALFSVLQFFFFFLSVLTFIIAFN